MPVDDAAIDPDTLEVDDDTLVSQQGIAEYFGLRRQSVNMWIQRAAYNGFPAPEPIPYLVGHKHGARLTQVWQLTKVIEWRRTYRPHTGAAAHRNRSRRLDS